MNVLDLFSGIGGFSLGLERAGMKTVAFCEIEEYPRRVLKKHWPDVPIYHDVRELTAEKLKNDGIGPIDVICGGFPCQDLSLAGKQAGIKAERSGLWSEFSRIISDIQPRYAIVENVTALISGDRGRWFGRVLGDLAEVGYDAEWHCIPASYLGAQHIRDRVWLIAYPNELANGEQYYNAKKRGNGEIKDNERNATNPNSVGLQGSDSESRKTKRKNESSEGGQAGRTHVKGVNPNPRIWQRSLKVHAARIRGEAKVSRDGYWKTMAEPFVDRRTYGVPNRLDRLRGLGNAVVPQIPELIGKAIMEVEGNDI